MSSWGLGAGVVTLIPGGRLTVREKETLIHPDSSNSPGGISRPVRSHTRLTGPNPNHTCREGHSATNAGTRVIGCLWLTWAGLAVSK